MLRLPLLFALALCACLSATGYQQPSALPLAPAIVLPEGQEIVLRNIDLIASNKSKPGDVVTFEVIRAISSDGLVVIPEHAVAVGRVLSAEHAGLAHHGGKLVVAIASVQLANGDYARLRAVESRKERNFGWRDVGGATLIAATIYYMPLAPVYLLAKGDDVNIPPGTRFTAYLDADVTVERASLEAAVLPPEGKHDLATIFIYRGNQDKAAAVQRPVSCGRLYLGSLTGETYLKVSVAPGRYWCYADVPATKLSASQQANEMVVLNVEAGKAYYVAVAFEPGKWKTIVPTIRQVDESVGGEEVFRATSGTVVQLPKTVPKELAKLSVKPKGVKGD